MENLKIVALLLSSFILLAAFALKIQDDKNDCHAKGGAFVGGVFGFECVAGPLK